MNDRLSTPDDMDQLKVILNNALENTHYISGGTDMILKLKADGFKDYHMVDLSGLKELKYITENQEDIEIGGGETLTNLVESPILQKYTPMLCQAADQVGSTQIRNVATIGGNVANSFAGADLIPPLFSLNAKVKILCPYDNRRIVSISDFITGNRQNLLNNNEIIESIIIEKPKGLQFFGKIGSRTRVTISKLNMAVRICLDKDIVQEAYVTFGALGASAFRSELVESYLIGKSFKDLDMEAYYGVFQSQVDAAIPTRQSRIYKREAVRGLAYDLHKSMLDHSIGSM